MFKTARVPCFLNTFGGHGDDTENKELKLVFQVTPITQELALEVSAELARQLFFRDDQNEWAPVWVMPKASFSKINVPLQNMTVNSLPENDPSDRGVLVPGAAISNLRAQRANPEAPDFRLEFDVVVPMDDTTMRLVEQYYKAVCFLSMEEIQRNLELEEGDADHQNSLQDAADGDDAVVDPEVPKKRGRKKKEVHVEMVLDGKSAGAGE